MTDKNVLIDWIHRVEFNPDAKTTSKRLPGLVIESYFERELAHRPELGLPEPLSYGWAYRKKYGCNDRQWFKMSEGGDSSIYKANSSFIWAILKCNPEDKFFLVQPGVALGAEYPVKRVSLSRT